MLRNFVFELLILLSIYLQSTNTLHLKPLQHFSQLHVTTSSNLKPQLHSQKNMHNQASEPLHDLYDVIVIGAGLSGTTVANLLAQQNNKVLILQAEDYIGGRTKTSSVIWPLYNTSVVYDDGASWFHQFEYDCPLTQLAMQLQIKLADTDYHKLKLYNEKWEDITYQYDQSLYEDFMEIVQQFDGLTIKEALQQLQPQVLHNPIFMNYLSSEYEGSSGATIRELPAFLIEEEDNEDANDHRDEIFVVDGLSKIAQYLTQNQNIEVRLSQAVVSVKRQQDFSTVRTENGGVYQAKKVIISVPLGVLKKGTIKFEPELPQQKQEAIENIGYGNLYKVFILVNKPVPQISEHVLRMVDKIQERGVAPIIYNLRAIADTPGYIAFMTGDKAIEAETMSQQKLKALLAKKMSNVLKTDIVGSDLTVRSSNWFSNPHFYGSYSFKGITTKKYHFEQMSRPVFENQWYFCGEHTHQKKASSTYGAFLSGLSTYKDIVDQVDEYSWNYKKLEYYF